MKNRTILILAALFGTVALFAQGLQESPLLQQKQQGEKDTKPFVSNGVRRGSNAHAAKSILQSTADKSYAYYVKVAKQREWFVGIGPALSKEEASHLNVVYKLSHKNNKGHWTKMEALDGYGNYTTEHDWDAYVAPRNSNSVSPEWADKLNSICQWELMADGSGEKVILERAYDEKMNLIFNYQPVYVSDNEIIGSYTDSWGMPAKMNGALGETSNVMVDVILDQWGNDSIIKLIDAEGNLVQNHAGAWMERTICDKHGNALEQYSLNKLGGPMNDDYGNCSWRATVDQFGNTLSFTYYDAGGNPVSLNSNKTLHDVKEERYEYDRWHRRVSQSFFDGERPDTTSQGVHKIEDSYNDHGQITSRIITGINSEPKKYGKMKFAYLYNTYDKKGRPLSSSLLGPDSTFIVDEAYYCNMLFKYEGDKLVRKEFYAREDGEPILWHLETFTPVEQIYFHSNDVAYVDTLDERGNLLSRTYISADQDPLLLKDRKPILHYPYSRMESTYQYSPYSCKETLTYYDFYGKWIDVYSNDNSSSIARKITVTDSIHHIKRYTEYNKDSLICAHYMETYDDDFNVMLFKQSLTPTGEVGRSRTNDLLYYKAKEEHSPSGKVTSILYLNEYDEPAYVYSEGKYYCYQLNGNSDNKEYYDENKEIVADSYESKPEVPCVEITSPQGLTNGLKDGDIIVKYADWIYNHEDKETKNDLHVKMIFAAVEDSIDIWVLRHFPSDRNNKIIKLKVKGDKCSDIGFVVNWIPLTNQERDRFLQTFIIFKLKEESEGSVISSVNRIASHWAYIGHPKGHNNPYLIISRNGEVSGWPAFESQQVYFQGSNRYPSSSLPIINYSEDGVSFNHDSIADYLYTESVYLTDSENQKILQLLERLRNERPQDLIPSKGETFSHLFKSAPAKGVISAKEFVDSIRGYRIGSQQNPKSSRITAHVEGIDTVQVFRMWSYSSVYSKKYRELTWLLDKNRYTLLAPSDTTQIAKQGVVYLHETPTGSDEFLYLSEDTVIWAKGNMSHGSKEILRNNLFGGIYNPIDKYSQDDLNSGDMAKKHEIASFWQAHQAYHLSLPVFKMLSKQKYGPTYTSLANAYLKGEGCKKDTSQAVSLYRKAIQAGEHVQKALGNIYLARQQYKYALNYLKSDADAKTCYQIGSIYEKGGHGVTVNPDSAVFYYRKGLNLLSNDYSAISDYYGAINRVEKNRHYSKFDFVEFTARTIPSNMTVDSLYKNGEKFYYNDDYKNAYPYLKAATDSLYPEAEEMMALFISNEKFPFHSEQKAKEYLQRAAEHYLIRAENGDSTAYYDVYWLYQKDDFEGNGLNKPKAKYYLQLGMEHNNSDCASKLGDIYKEEFKYKEALDAYLVAAKAGRSNCMYKVAQLFEQGIGGVEKNITEAVSWYRKYLQSSASNKDKEKATNALKRLGVPLEMQNTDMVGVWIRRDINCGKVFLPNGSFFGIYYNNRYTLSTEIENCLFRPWMIGTYSITGKSEYVENVKMRDIKSYLGEQPLIFQISNNTMNTIWNSTVKETWVKSEDSDILINHIMENWDKYSNYIRTQLSK